MAAVWFKSNGLLLSEAVTHLSLGQLYTYWRGRHKLVCMPSGNDRNAFMFFFSFFFQFLHLKKKQFCGHISFLLTNLRPNFQKCFPKDFCLFCNLHSKMLRHMRKWRHKVPNLTPLKSKFQNIFSKFISGQFMPFFHKSEST